MYHNSNIMRTEVLVIDDDTSGVTVVFKSSNVVLILNEK